MKKLIATSAYALICSTQLCFSYSLNPIPYNSTAKTWINDYFVNPQGQLTTSAEDLQIVANLAYFSYLRSITTLQAQEAGMAALQEVWHGWHNITQTRLNPAHAVPYAIDPALQTKIFTRFTKLQTAHHVVGMAYVHSVNDIMSGSLLQSAQAPYAVDRLRNAARAEVLETFLSLKNQMDVLQDCINSMLKKDISEFIDNSERWSLSEILLSFLPGFALSSFLALEKCYTTASKETWTAFSKLQDINVAVYTAIEQTRASFYLAHYRQLYELLAPLDDSYKTICFSQNGFLPTEQRKDQLPVL